MGDEEFVVYCVEPSGEDDENSSGSGVQTAYDIMLENGFNPVWVKTAECLKVKERQKNCVYIIDPFKGSAFDHISSVGCRVFGPQCVLSCLHLKLGIPKTKVPIYSLAMKDLTISCTSLDKKTREDVMCKVQWMGGKVSKDFTDDVTHLVAGKVGSKKYIVAGGLGKHIMAPEWVDQVWVRGKHRHLHGTDEQFQKYKCPIFKNTVVTVSGLDTEKRKQVKSFIEAEGGSYSGEMKVNECTHLIINEPKGQKYEFARKWKIQIVSVKWLSDSVEKGFCQDENQYRLETEKPQVSTSTPNRTRKGIGQGLSNMGDLSSISHLPDLSRLDETGVNNATRTASIDEADALLELDLNKFNTDLFLDGCRIYLSGFRGPCLEKLRKIINFGGATRYHQINDSITHVVMGEKIPTDVKTLQQANFRPHVVSAAWLVDSLRRGKQQEEKGYYCLELPALQSASPKPKISKRPSADSTAIRNATDVNNGTTDEDREMAALMSQYMKPDKDTTVQPGEPAPVAEPMDTNEPMETHEPMETQGDITQETEMEGQEGGIFAGKKFIFLGFEDDQLAELAGYTEENGGKIISGPSRQVCDYAIVPIGGYRVNVTVSDVLTNTWLQMCLEQEELLPVDSNELFHPLEIREESSPLQGCVLSISGFAGTERDCLMHIAEVLGASSSGSCSHLVGLLIALQNWLLMGFTDIPDELACTSLPQQWNVPRGNKIEPEAVPQITIIKPHPNRKRKPVENTVNDCRNAIVTREDTDHLKSLTGLPISYLVSHPKKVVETPFGKVGIGSGLSTHGSFYALQKSQIVATDCGNLAFPQTTCVYLPPEYHPLPQNIVINIDSAKKIEEDTRLQANCEKWFSERRKRITASKFAEVRKRKVFTPKYIDSLINSKPFTSLATNHGKSFECRARQEYVKTSGNHVHDCGLVVNPEFPFIGATPDGKVCDNGTCGILEVKCPYTARDMSLSDATKLPNFCLKKSEDGHGLTLKNSHDYYCQVQGQLLVTGSPFCDFIVYTKKGLHIERIYPCKEFMEELLSTLSKVYFQHLYPMLNKT